MKMFRYGYAVFFRKRGPWCCIWSYLKSDVVGIAFISGVKNSFSITQLHNFSAADFESIWKHRRDIFGNAIGVKCLFNCSILGIFGRKAFRIIASLGMSPVYWFSKVNTSDVHLPTIWKTRSKPKVVQTINEDRHTSAAARMSALRTENLCRLFW